MSFSCLRNPRTRNEARSFFNALDQGVKPRGRRSPANLPDAYDDVRRTDGKCRSWKKWRNTQWKER